MAKKVFVGNLPYSVGDDQLREGFEAYGEVVSANVVLDRETQRPRGFGFVEFATDEAAQAAIAGLNGQDFHGRGITVREAEDRRRGIGGVGRPSRPPAGGGYRGAPAGGGYRGGGGGGGGPVGGGSSAGFGSGGYGGGGFSRSRAQDGMPPVAGPDTEDSRRRKKKRKGARKERDWDREGAPAVGAGRGERKRRNQDYLDYDDYNGDDDDE